MQRFATASLVIFLLTAVGRATGFAREALMAFYLGASADTDQYLTALLLYDWAATLGSAVLLAGLTMLPQRRSNAGSFLRAYRIYAREKRTVSARVNGRSLVAAGWVNVRIGFLMLLGLA